MKKTMKTRISNILKSRTKPTTVLKTTFAPTPTRILKTRFAPTPTRILKTRFAPTPKNKVLNGLFNTNDLKGCAMFGAENWNALKNTVATVTSDALSGRLYIIPTVISCPQNMAAELLGFNDIYARSLGENFYNNTWPVIKSNSAVLLGSNPLEWIQDNIFDSKVGNVVKQGGHIASNVLAKTPIGGWINIGRDTNDWMSNIWDSLVGKKKSEEETPTAVKAGGGLLILAGVGVGAYFLLKDDKKKKRG